MPAVRLAEVDPIRSGIPWGGNLLSTRKIPDRLLAGNTIRYSWGQVMQRQFWRHNPHLIPQSPQPGTTSLPFQVSLEIVRGQAKQRMRPILNPAFLIGMADDCDLVLGDPQFPEVHAYIRIATEGVTLRHLGFSPSLTINGELATQQLLADGDRIRTGPYEFLVHLQPQAAGDDDSTAGRSLRLPAAMDRVEDEVGNALVQQLLTQIRSELLPGPSRLKLFVDHELISGKENSAPIANGSQDQRHVYARSS